MVRTAIILAGHGSQISPHTAGLVWEQVDRLRALGVADEITAAFWKETPSFHQVLDTLTASDVTIVPLFTAQGYFTQTVIPTEMGLEGSVTVRNGRTLRYTRTLGEHPSLGEVVHKRIEDALRLSGASPHQTAVAIIGHGTPRSSESRAAAEQQASHIRTQSGVAEVIAVYLDDSPNVSDVYDLTSAPTLIAVPYFLALGSHTTIDVPQALSLQAGQSAGQVRGRRVYYTQPVGIEDSLCNMVLDLAREAGTPLRPPQPGSTWDCFPASGRDTLLKTVFEMGVLEFGQLNLTPSEVHPINKGQSLETLTDTGALRHRVREAPFRPLATAMALPGGWCVPITQPEMLHAVVETVYPGTVADWAAHQSGNFTAQTLSTIAARQTGMFRPLDQLDIRQRGALVEHVCGNCICHATWHYSESPPGTIPCAEPCNFWMSQALEFLD